MKKNKTIAYMLAATLLVGGTFLGTKALFYDEIESVGELRISTGDVDIDVSSEGWKMVGTRNETNHGTTENKKNELQSNLANFDNLKNGDIIEKTITVTNNGTLNADLKLIENTAVTNPLPEGIDFTTSFLTGNEGYLGTIDGGVLQPGKSVDVKLKIEVIGGGLHIPDNNTTIDLYENSNDGLNSDTQERIIINLENAYTLKADQTQSGSKQN